MTETVEEDADGTEVPAAPEVAEEKNEDDEDEEDDDDSDDDVQITIGDIKTNSYELVAVVYWHFMRF